MSKKMMLNKLLVGEETNKAKARGSPPLTRNKTRGGSKPAVQTTETPQKATPKRHKPHFCIFCREEFDRINMHLRRRHAKEKRVREILEIEDRKTKNWEWRKLINEGDLIKNRIITRGEGGELKSVRKAQVPDKPKKYISCEYCLGRMISRNYASHLKICGLKGSKRPPDETTWEIDDDDDDNFYEDVVKDMKGDFPEYILNNKMAYKFGRNLWEEKAYRQEISVRQKLRDIRELEENLVKTEKDKKLGDFFHVRHTDAVISVIKQVSGFQRTGKKVEIKAPSKMLRFLRVVEDFGRFIEILYLKREKKERAERVKDFLTVFHVEASTKLKNLVRHYEKQKKLNLLPGP